jgi:hypothetical protein
MAHRYFLQGCLLLGALLAPASALHADDYRLRTQEDFLAASQRTYGPGDRVLLERGKRFTGQLRIRAHGEPGNVVTVGAFGEGELPVIDGDGLSDDQGVLQLDDPTHVEICDLEITNAFGTKTRSYGILAEDRSGKEHGHIHIRNCYVHHITSDDSNTSAGSSDKHLGGIHLVARKPTKWDDLLVENNRVEYAGRSGITVTSWRRRHENGRASFDLEDTSDCITNLRIRGNRVAYASGDGIILLMAYKGLVEHNVAHHCGYRGNGKPTQVSASIWGGWKNIDCVFQYNEAYAHQRNSDASGFNLDKHSKGTVIQYNYSHDNHGGFLMLWGGYLNRDNIVRHNVSVNERPFGRRGVGNKGFVFENNTVYLSEAFPGTFELWAPLLKDNLFAAIKGSFEKQELTNEKVEAPVRIEGDFYFTPAGANPLGESSPAPGFVEPCGRESPIGLEALGGLRLKPGSPAAGRGADIDQILEHAPVRDSSWKTAE